VSNYRTLRRDPESQVHPWPTVACGYTAPHDLIWSIRDSLDQLFNAERYTLGPLDRRRLRKTFLNGLAELDKLDAFDGGPR
jgi:hypothetical protein